MLKDKGIVLILALTASLPVMVSYNIVGEELLWYLLEAEQILGFSIDRVYRLLVALVNLATAGIAYASFRSCFQSSTIGVLACALYTLAPYRLYLLYTRSAVGEYIAMMFLPLILWGVHGICRASRKEKGYLWNWLILIVGLWGTIHPYILGLSARKGNDDNVINAPFVGMDSALLLCVLLWIGLQLKGDKEALSKGQRCERRIANLALLVGVVLILVNPGLIGVATLCILITVSVMGKCLLQEEKAILPGNAVIYALIVMALIFGTYQVNEILMTSGNLMFV